MFFKKSDLHIHKEDFLLLPNILTYIRFLLVPAFIIVYMNAESLSDHVASAILIVVSGITDVADGFIARHWNLTSDLGKIIDLRDVTEEVITEDEQMILQEELSEDEEILSE